MSNLTLYLNKFKQFNITKRGPEMEKPLTYIPIILLLACVGAVELLTYMPWNEDDAGAVPRLLISKPAI